MLLAWRAHFFVCLCSRVSPLHPSIPTQIQFNSPPKDDLLSGRVSPLKVMSTRWMLDAAETSTLTHDMQKLLQQLNLSREDVLVFCVYVKMLNATPRHGVINQN